jgi:hypothetical protein
VPLFISTDLPAPDRAVAKPDALARSFFAAYSDLYRMQNSEAELSLDRIESDTSGMQHIRFNQVVNDVPVFGGQLIVHLQNDRIQAVNGNYFPDVKVDTAPEFGQDAAVALVRADVHRRSNCAPIARPGGLRGRRPSASGVEDQCIQREPGQLVIFVDARQRIVLVEPNGYCTQDHRLIRESLPLNADLRRYDEIRPVAPAGCHRYGAYQHDQGLTITRTFCRARRYLIPNCARLFITAQTTTTF